jgi:hypothetical protein
MSQIPVSPPAAVRQRVAELLARWRAETAHLSSSTQRHQHPAYQEIISLGADALPALFHDLEQTRDGHLSKALTAITGAHPVPAADRGRVAAVADAWLHWARAQGYTC